MIGIIDYGMGNLRSVEKAFQYIGREAKIIDEVKMIRDADALVLPGVGAFPDAMELLNEKGFTSAIREEAEKGKIILGICLGMQLLFDKSYEVKEVDGLHLLKGEIKEIKTDLKIPHIGWNSLVIKKDNHLLNGIKDGDNVYFVHSYYLTNGDEENICATTEYGIEIPAVVCKDNIFSCQFHPEKSGYVGLRILKNFAELI
ncbi:imidazole glycerol phosphate synthase subunit HisH [Thermoanaerobacterium sp. CMT5567-10]|uniref:imidazole glycerol phosphate synthase subunit HisH n=1 Tax=Thermoanaerobacterium sp. CMT5567-10 TaxID=3061989 RepID=UPI0026E0DC59|nr:imidazole glycerol phosphate synthase subunit HisH [Thermoanaerobacterium sp. CMT5567-10]WKV10406.1 imidazole glycerol phosphate synthase subunit HisH [Thermoanaerobacterium sp. CMT5567-10]